MLRRLQTIFLVLCGCACIIFGDVDSDYEFRLPNANNTNADLQKTVTQQGLLIGNLTGALQKQEQLQGDTTTILNTSINTLQEQLLNRTLSCAEQLQRTQTDHKLTHDLLSGNISDLLQHRDMLAARLTSVEDILRNMDILSGNTVVRQHESYRALLERRWSVIESRSRDLVNFIENQSATLQQLRTQVATLDQNLTTLTTLERNLQDYDQRVAALESVSSVGCWTDYDSHGRLCGQLATTANYSSWSQQCSTSFSACCSTGVNGNCHWHQQTANGNATSQIWETPPN